MSKFKVGDRVRFLPYKNNGCGAWQNITLIKYDDTFGWCGVDDNSELGSGYFGSDENLELIEPATDTANPAHYRQGDIECIDAIRAQLTPEQFKGYLKASLVKYVWRYEHKGNAEGDLLKAQWFLERLIGEVRDGD